METNWRITYRNACYYFAEAESAFRFFLGICNRRDAKAVTIEVLYPEGVWKTVKA